MGANSIDISQYRSRIGTFAGKKVICQHRSSSASFGNGLKTKNLMETFVMLSYLLILSGVTQKLLIMSGVEINPGPFYLGKKLLISIYTFVKTHLRFVMKKPSFSNLLICFY